MEEKLVLCGANSYVEKYYFNEQFSGLPEAVKQELQIMCVMFTQDVGGIFLVELDENGNLQLRTEAADHIGIENIRRSRLLRLEREREEIERNFKAGKQVYPDFRLSLLVRLEA